MIIRDVESIGFNGIQMLLFVRTSNPDQKEIGKESSVVYIDDSCCVVSITKDDLGQFDVTIE